MSKPSSSGIRAEDITIVHRVIGTKHVLTSPDVPELHVSHAEEAVARSHLQPALDVLSAMKARIARRGSGPVRAEDITIEHEIVGEQHLLTSPDVPGLYVVHRDEAVARGNVQSALDMLDRMRRRPSRLPHPLDASEG